MTFATACKIGWRNIWRNRIRSFLTLMAIAFASMVLVFFIALQLSSWETSINATVSIFYGHLQVQRDEYLNKPQMRNTLSDAEQLRSVIEVVPGVDAVSARGIGFALASSKECSYGTQIVGVDPAVESSVSTIAGVVRRGRYLTDSSAHEAILGSLLARNLKVTVGSELTLLGQGWDGSLAATVIPVVGIFETGSNEIDRGMIQIPLATFQEVFAMPNKAHTLVVRADQLSEVDRIQREIGSLLADREETVVLRWDEVVPGLKEAIELDMAAAWLFYISLILIVTFSILNTFLMSVLERTKEFGIMLALGTKPLRISMMVLLECGLLTIVGIAIGVVLGLGLTLYFGKYGFAVPGAEEVAKQWNLPVVVYTQASWAAVTRGPTVLLVAALFSVLYPAFRILGLKPVEAIGGR